MSQTNTPTTKDSAGESITSPQPAPSARRQPEPREGSTLWAAIEVLRGKRKPMTAAEIYAEIRERNLAPGLKGKTPEQTVAARLAVATKRGPYVERVEPGKFRLRRGAGPAGAT